MGTYIDRYYPSSADVTNDGCSLALFKDNFDGKADWRIVKVHTEPKLQGRGYATRLMLRMAKWADKRGITLRLTAAPFWNSPLSLEKTMAMYVKVGFVVDPEGRSGRTWQDMIRFPRPQGS